MSQSKLPFEGLEDIEKKSREKPVGYQPPNLGKAVKVTVPDFNDPDRPAVCLEIDFPIAPVNALSNLEGNAGKPIYQMSKWWARRRSSVFRSLLLAAATQAPEDETMAGKQVWENYYANHQKAKNFSKLRVLDPFMGGGTTLVEGARLGFQMTGVDLNPVAWFVVKNELACSDPEQVQAFFEYIEGQVKPVIQPFYTTTCPRGHEGRWVDIETEQVVDFDPITLAPEARLRYRWEGPEIIYTFWGKHGPCKADGCGHRTPLFKSPVISEKRLTAQYLPLTCPHCGKAFNAELGETRIAPGAERVILPSEPTFTELSQEFANLLGDYSKGATAEKRARITRLLEIVDHEQGLHCPHCDGYAGKPIKQVIERHAKAQRISDIKKKDLNIASQHVYMYLLVHPDWLEGYAGEQDGQGLGGWVGADPDSTAAWWQARNKNLRLIEVRGRIKLSEESALLDLDEDFDLEDSDEGETSEEPNAKGYGLPREITLADGTRIKTSDGTIPARSTFTCQKCGREQDILESVKASEHSAPVVAYALQCHCPQCEEEKYNYGGRYFKEPDAQDDARLIAAEHEWAERSEGDLKEYWPREELFYSYMTHRLNGGIPNWGYTHWWKMFNPRQLIVHACLLKAIMNGNTDQLWPLDVREQALGAFQQFLRNHNMFVFWNYQRDTPEPMFSNANYHPKSQVVENCVFATLGRGNWKSSSDKIVIGLEWVNEPWELAIGGNNATKSEKAFPGDGMVAGSEVFCGSSTDLSFLNGSLFDLVITDPPFGDNLFYADLADFFYVWLRIPLKKWYAGLPEEAYFSAARTPHAVEAIRNPVEHPDEREEWETRSYIRQEHVSVTRQLAGDNALNEGDPNPLYRPEPASDFYRQTLAACWSEAGRLLKPGGLMAFTFHHSADEPWLDVLEALFNAGYVLVATYPIRSDETKGDGGAFGSRKIEYDIVHVCRKRLEPPQPTSYSRMLRWVKSEVQHLKTLLEHAHGKTLPSADTRVILRGKALEFYSRHYGQVLKGDGQILTVRDALLGINLTLDDLLQGTGPLNLRRVPEDAEPVSRLFLRVFQNQRAMTRDELHKTLRGTGFSQDDIESLGWIDAQGTNVRAKTVEERYRYFTSPGRNRKVMKVDLDQAHFLIGAALPNSGLDIISELDRKTFNLKKSVTSILDWYAQMDTNAGIRRASEVARGLVIRWREQVKQAAENSPTQLPLFAMLEEMEDD
jgi:putative DNA methylase